MDMVDWIQSPLPSRFIHNSPSVPWRTHGNAFVAVVERWHACLRWTGICNFRRKSRYVILSFKLEASRLKLRYFKSFTPEILILILPKGYLNDLWRYFSSNNTWNFLGGSSALNSVGQFGTKGVPSTSNLPPARALSVYWQNRLSQDAWLFGGRTVGSKTKF